MVKYIGRGLAVKRPGVLSKVQMLKLVLGAGVFSLLPRDSVWSFLLKVEIWFDLFYLWLPPGRKLDLVFFACGPPPP